MERENYIKAVAEKYRVGYDNLRKLVAKVAIKNGLAKPAEKPRQTVDKNKGKEDGNIQSQKILLTWLIENERVFAQIKKYIVVDEESIDVRLTNQANDDGTNGAPSLYANIPIVNIKNDNVVNDISDAIIEATGDVNEADVVSQIIIP